MTAALRSEGFIDGVMGAPCARSAPAYVAGYCSGCLARVRAFVAGGVK